MSISEIISLTRKYAAARAKLLGRCMLIQRAIDRIQANNLPYLRAASIAVRTAEDDLYRAIDGARDLFQKPKTITIDDIKVGLRKQKGTMLWEDDAEVIARIRKVCPDIAAALIRVTETPDKKMLAELPGDTLKKLGITITADSEAVTISTAESDAEKIAQALLAEPDSVNSKKDK